MKRDEMLNLAKDGLYVQMRLMECGDTVCVDTLDRKIPEVLTGILDDYVKRNGFSPDAMIIPIGDFLMMHVVSQRMSMFFQPSSNLPIFHNDDEISTICGVPVLATGLFDLDRQSRYICARADGDDLEFTVYDVKNPKGEQQ